MSAETWGLLQKSQESSQTIEERIVELIAEHEADSSAHLGAGESLETHKSESVIDHPADSILNDKIPENEIDPYKLASMFNELSLNWQALTDAEITKSSTATVDSVLGDLTLTTNVTNNNYARLFHYVLPEGLMTPYRRCALIFQADFPHTTNVTASTGLGYDEGTFIGFRETNGVIYAIICDGGVEYKVNITSSFISYYDTLKLKLTPGQDVKFYVGQTLVATINIPTGFSLEADTGFFAYIKTTNTTSKSLHIYPVKIIYDTVDIT